jgi:hypothetical protein
MRDVFGRQRHADMKSDLTGIGSFNDECKTLFFSGIPLPKHE